MMVSRHQYYSNVLFERDLVVKVTAVTGKIETHCLRGRFPVDASFLRQGYCALREVRGGFVNLAGIDVP